MSQSKLEPNPGTSPEDGPRTGRRATTQGDAFGVHGVLSPLVGRGHEVSILEGLLKQALEYQAPQIVTIVGNQGTGKSRLVDEWARQVAERGGVRVFRGRATAPTARYSAVARLLRHRFDLGEGEDADSMRDRFRDAVQVVFGDRRVGEVVHFLGGFLGIHFAESPFVRAFEDNSKQYDEIARAVMRRFIEVDASISPLVLILDDLHQADDDTLIFLEELAEGMGGSPVVLVLCARPELLVRRPRWLASGDHTRIELRNLDDEQSAEMFRNLLSRCDMVSADLVEDAVEMTGGNPFFLEQLVRVFIANGTIDASGPTWRIDFDKAAETELPISVEEAIEARIAALEDPERDLLEKGATFGNVFWLSAVVALSRTDRLEDEERDATTPPPPPTGWTNDGLKRRFDVVVNELVARDYLLRLPAEDSSIPGDVELVFKHNLERELVTKLTPADRRKRYHRMAAQWLESRIRDRSEEQFEFLAQLYERGGDARRAAYCYIAGGDQARARFSNDNAIHFYTRGLQKLGNDDMLARIDALHNLGDVQARVGKTEEAARSFQEMLRLAWLLDYTAKGGAAHGRLGRLHRQKGEYKKAEEHFRLGHELFYAAGDRRGVAGALDDVGMVYWLKGQYKAALEHYRKALSIRRGLGDRRSIALSLANIGRVHQDSGSFKAAVEQLKEALEIRREIGDKPGMVSSLCDIGAVHEADGNLESARSCLVEALNIARQIGDRLAQAHVLLRLGQVDLEGGMTREAAEELKEAYEIVTPLGDVRGQAECALKIAEAYVVMGDPSRAAEYARGGLGIAERIGSQVLVGTARRILGEIGGVTARSPAEQQKAHEEFRQSLEVLTQLKNELELARAYRAYARFQERTGNHQQAADLRARADEIFGRLRGAASLSS